jgi:hypothetical protein
MGDVRTKRRKLTIIGERLYDVYNAPLDVEMVIRQGNGGISYEPDRAR